MQLIHRVPEMWILKVLPLKVHLSKDSAYRYLYWRFLNLRLTLTNVVKLWKGSWGPIRAHYLYHSTTQLCSTISYILVIFSWLSKSIHRISTERRKESFLTVGRKTIKRSHVQSQMYQAHKYLSWRLHPKSMDIFKDPCSLGIRFNMPKSKENDVF